MRFHTLTRVSALASQNKDYFHDELRLFIQNVLSKHIINKVFFITMMAENGGTPGGVRPSLVSALESLRAKMDAGLSLKKTPDNLDNLREYFQVEILPHLLELRYLNRAEKSALEARFDATKEANQQLASLVEQRDNIIYQHACLSLQVTSKRSEEQFKMPDGIGSHLDHQTKMRLLTEEEVRRKDLQEKLLQLTSEVKIIEQTSTKNEKQLNHAKPYIEQLINAVDLTISL